jgi:hypothetical protein
MKKIQKRRFLILFLTQENTFLITPHPKPLPAFGERVRVRGFYFKNQIKKLTFLKILLRLETVDYLGFSDPPRLREFNYR